MLRIGLTGGIGSGKSTVDTALRARGFHVIDADQIARQVVDPVPRALLDAFGSDLVDASGRLERTLLARRAFVDEESTRLLNAIMHPLIREETARQWAAAEAAGLPLAIYDAPLLVDLGLHRDMDYVVVIDVPVEERVRRLVGKRNLSASDARARIARQVEDAARLAAADFVVDNSGSLPDLEGEVDRLADWLRTL